MGDKVGHHRRLPGHEMEDPARRGLEPLRHVNDPPDDVVDGHEVEVAPAVAGRVPMRPDPISLRKA